MIATSEYFYLFAGTVKNGWRSVTKRINRLARRAEIKRRRESEFQWPMRGLSFEKEVETNGGTNVLEWEESVMRGGSTDKTRGSGL